MATAPVLARALERATDPGSDLVVDVGALTFIDAAGLRVLAAADERLRGHGHRLRLQRPSAQLRRLLAVLGLEHLAS